MRSAALHPVVDRPPDERATTGAEDGPEGLVAAGRDHVAEHATGHGADDETRGPVVAPAVIAIVVAAVDAVVAAVPIRLLPATAAIVPGGVVAAPNVDAAVIVVPPVIGYRPIVMAAIVVVAPILMAVALVMLLRQRGRWLQAQGARHQRCHNSQIVLTAPILRAVGIDLPRVVHSPYRHPTPERHDGFGD